MSWIVSRETNSHAIKGAYCFEFNVTSLYKQRKIQLFHVKQFLKNSKLQYEIEHF